MQTPYLICQKTKVSANRQLLDYCAVDVVIGSTDYKVWVAALWDWLSIPNHLIGFGEAPPQTTTKREGEPFKGIPTYYFI